MTTRLKYWLHISSANQATPQVNTAVSPQTARNFGLTCPSVPTSLSVFPHRLTWPASAPFRVRALRPVSGQLSPGPPAEGPTTRPEVSCCLSATGFGFSGHPLPARGLGPSSRSAYPAQPRARTLTGLPRSTHASYDRGGCLLYPEGDGTHPADKKSSTGACRSSAAQPLHPAQTTHQRGSHITRHQRRFTRFTRPALPSPVAPMDGTGTLGLEP